MSNCAGCKIVVADDEIINCSNCPENYHYSCVGMTRKEQQSYSTSATKNWLCPECRKCMKKDNRDQTPVQPTLQIENGDKTYFKQHSSWVNQRNRREQSANDSLMDIQANYVNVSQGQGKSDDITDTIRKTLSSEMSAMRTTISKEFSSLKTELKEVRSEISSLKEAMDFISGQYEDMKILVEKKSQDNRLLRQENDKLQVTTNHLLFRVNDLEQEARANNVEIQCVSEYQAESLLPLVQQLAKTVGLMLKEEDIHLCTRTAKTKAESARPRSIVLKLSTPQKRDSLIEAVKCYKKSNPADKLGSKHLGIAGPKSDVFVTEHLTPHNRELHYLARQAGKDKGYKFIWIKGGRVFMQKSEKSKIYCPKDKEFFANLP